MVSKERAAEVITYANEHGEDEASIYFAIPLETIARYRRVFNSSKKETAEIDPDETLVRLEASKQRLLDVNNVLRKENREAYRLMNGVEEVYKEYVELLKKCPLASFTLPTIETKTTKRYGIIHLTDLHLNELITEHESNGNSYDFTIASKRLKKYVEEAKVFLRACNVSGVYVFCTGDIINSNRRISEKLAQASSQVRASLLATYLIQQVIIDLAQEWEITFAGVVGNESRIGEIDFDSSDILSSENWDYMIYQQLKMLFAGKPVEFLEAKNNTQMVVTLDNGFNALLVHGNYLKGTISDKQIASLLQSYAYRGIPIHAVYLGHIHSSMIGDIVSRGSSLCGGNAYSGNDLMFVSRASQNLYIVNEDFGYHGIKIDVQNATNEGYHILPELERYDVRGVRGTSRVVIENVI